MKAMDMVSQSRRRKWWIKKVQPTTNAAKMYGVPACHRGSKEQRTLMSGEMTRKMKNLRIPAQ